MQERFWDWGVGDDVWVGLEGGSEGAGNMCSGARSRVGDMESCDCVLCEVMFVMV